MYEKCTFIANEGRTSNLNAICADVRVDAPVVVKIVKKNTINIYEKREQDLNKKVYHHLIRDIHFQMASKKDSC